MQQFYKIALCFIFLPAALLAQQKNKLPAATPAALRLQGVAQREKLTTQSLVQNVPLRNIGPAIMSGRVVDLAVNPSDPTDFYVAYASGGLWRTQNNGSSFVPLFDQAGVMTIGDIAVDWKTHTIWVGTGENNASRSSYAGLGIYKSTDQGKTWQHSGLPESHHIGRIVLHPEQPDIAWVAVTGHLYSPNKERGVYKTINGGQTWQQTLYINPNAGAIDLVADPAHPNVLYAATWERERRAWDFTESGVGTGIYKSTDGGQNWQKLSTSASGFPTGVNVGRIGLAVHPQIPNLVYAVVDNQSRRPPENQPPGNQKIIKEDLRRMSNEAFLQLSDQQVTDFLTQHNFPKKYSAAYLKAQVARGQLKPIALVEFIEDANTVMFDRPVTGAEVYRSENGGQTWHKTHTGYLNDFYYSYGYYFGQIRVAPTQPATIYILGVPILKSEDGGQTFSPLDAANVHPDHHALWVNPARPGHLINGNDGGINISYDNGATWLKANTPAVGQFYAVAVDMEKPYQVYGGLQDNGVWYGPSNYRAEVAWHQEGNYPYKRLLGGDGMQVAVDTRDNQTLYTGSQYGNYFRINRKTGERLAIQPKHALGERPLRFNWQTPIHLSRHNQDIIYLGSHKLHRSLNQGEDMQAISGDLTKGGRPGDVGYGTLTTLDESPLKFGLLYTGSDDGLIHVSPDGGNTWNRISDKLPPDLWVSRVVASGYQPGRVYAALNGYRYDHFQPYLYVSENYGQTWMALGQNLPPEPINVVKEDPRNARCLYVGTDHGVYFSLNRGQSFMRLAKDLPAVAVHDLVVHPREPDLIIGTHGRSIYLASLEHVQQLTDSVLQKPLHAFLLRDIPYNPQWGQKSYAWAPPLVPQLTVPYYVRNAGPVTLRIRTEAGLVLNTYQSVSDPGLNYFQYDLSIKPEAAEKYTQYLNQQHNKNTTPMSTLSPTVYLHPGKYYVDLETGDHRQTQTFTVRGQAP